MTTRTIKHKSGSITIEYIKSENGEDILYWLDFIDQGNYITVTDESCLTVEVSTLPMSEIVNKYQDQLNREANI